MQKHAHDCESDALDLPPWSPCPPNDAHTNVAKCIWSSCSPKKQEGYLFCHFVDEETALDASSNPDYDEEMLDLVKETWETEFCPVATPLLHRIESHMSKFEPLDGPSWLTRIGCGRIRNGGTERSHLNENRPCWQCISFIRWMFFATMTRATPRFSCWTVVLCRLTVVTCGNAMSDACLHSHLLVNCLTVF